MPSVVRHSNVEINQEYPKEILTHNSRALIVCVGLDEYHTSILCSTTLDNIYSNWASFKSLFEIRYFKDCEIRLLGQK